MIRKHAVLSVGHWVKRAWILRLVLPVMIVCGMGCATYPMTKQIQSLDSPGVFHTSTWKDLDRADDLLFFVAFSGGGTRAAAFSYGVLEELRDTPVGSKRLLDEIDAISGVSGGSFTAAYYGLFGDRIFSDFRSRFLTADVQGALVNRVLFNPYNWARLYSSKFDRSDLAAEYYDEHIFEQKTFADLYARRGPSIIINATEMVTGARLSFNRDRFDMLCTDLMSFPVSRAVAASAAVPVLLSPITIKNYAGTCGYVLPERLAQSLRSKDTSTRLYQHAHSINTLLDAERAPYLHLIDGGVADNLGMRAFTDRLFAYDSFADAVDAIGLLKKVRKVVFLVVNAETEVTRNHFRLSTMPSMTAMLDAYLSIAVSRYNLETMMLLRERFASWRKDVQNRRCEAGMIDDTPGACGDIRFYLIEVKFDALADAERRSALKQLPTSFVLEERDVDHLRASARQILREAPDFQRLLSDLREGDRKGPFPVTPDIVSIPEQAGLSGTRTQNKALD